jgi:isopenicillin-N epimerase
MLASASRSRLPAPPAVLGRPWGEPVSDAPDRFWRLDPTYTFLNHGSFGSVPAPIDRAQAEHRARIEARPIELLGRRCAELLAPARATVARFLGADEEGIGFVTNATEAVNAVLRSIDWRPGDVLVTTDHVYNAVHQTMRYVARARGAEVRVVPLPLPIRDGGEVVAAIDAALDPRVRLVILDHVTSPTAVVFPAAAVTRLCRERGIECLVDGAHVAGMLPLDIGGLGATYYAGNLHKWTCAPKGSAFLWVAPERRAATHPAVVSHFLDGGLRVEFDWQGTRDISAWLVTKEAIELGERTVGWEAIRRHNHELATWAQAMLCERLGLAAHTPLDGSMLGSMATVPLPESMRTRFATVEALQADLYGRERIEVPIVDWGGRWHCRVSCQGHNRPEQYERLATALGERFE